MSDAWNEGYFTDVGYTYGYYREIAPNFMRFCLLLRGFEPGPASDTQHCELGFGQGVSANIHAAATSGHYFGNDFTPSQAAHAIRLASAAGSGAEWTDASFEQLLQRTDLPQFDSISLHGIWAWITKSNRQHIVEFARRHLKPGGIFYVSYNCYPGWSPAAPLRHLFAQYNRHAATPAAPDKRVGDALTFTKALLAAKPGYAAQVPNLEKRLDKIMEQNRTYLAHEYFNREWNCMYFTDVVDELEAAKLSFACSAVPLDAVDLVNLTKQAQEFLESIENPVLREQARDYFVNQQFRRDIFVRGTTRLAAGEQRKRLLETRFVLNQWPDDVPMKVKNGGLGDADLVPELYQPVIAALATNNLAPKTLQHLLQAMPADRSSYSTILQVITVLVAMGAVSPCQSEEEVRKVKPRCDALNRHIFEEARYSAKVLVMASPVIGMAGALDRFSMLFVLAGINKHKDPVQFTWDILQANNEVLMKDDIRLMTAEENIAELHERHARFKQKIQPILKALGVI